MRFLNLIHTIDKNNSISEVSRNTRTLALEASELLYWFLLENPTNQALGYQNIQYYIKVIDENVKGTNLTQLYTYRYSLY